MAQNIVDESPRKKRLRRQLFQAVRRSRVKSKKVKVLGQKIKRYKKTIQCLKHVIEDLTKKIIIFGTF